MFKIECLALNGIVSIILEMSMMKVPARYHFVLNPRVSDFWPSQVQELGAPPTENVPSFYLKYKYGTSILVKSVHL